MAPRSDLVKPLLFVLLSIIWGSTWLVIKTGYGGLGPFNVAGIRFLLAGAIIVPMGFAMKVKWPAGRAEWGLAVFVGIVLFGLDYGLIYWAELVLESGITAVLFATMPLLTAFAAHCYIPTERLTIRKLGGTLLAFAGVVALFAGKLRVDPEHAWPMLAIIASALCAAVASVATKRHGASLHPVAFNGPAMLIGGVAHMAASLAIGDGFHMPTATGTWLAIVYLAVAGSVLTFLVYFWLLKTWDATTMSFIAIFTPAIAILLGFLVLDEVPGPAVAVGIVLILAGVALAVTKSGRSRGVSS